jgi:hypothetical protein
VTVAASSDHTDTGLHKARSTGALEAVRAFGVVFGGPVTLIAVAIAGAVSVARSIRGGQAPRPLATWICVAAALYAKVLRPWHLRWGSTPADTARPLPGDELLPEVGTDIVHAITIDAPPEAVWPWVAQLGQDRGGFYSYEWLENLAGCEMVNADRVHPEWQWREIGELVFLHPSGGLEVTVFEPGRALGLRGWGTVMVEPFESGRSRLIVRGRIPSGLVAAGYAALMEIPHFVMERRMLLGIKERAEQSFMNELAVAPSRGHEREPVLAA